MDLNEFWHLIDESRLGLDRRVPEGNLTKQLEAAGRLLSRRTPEEIARFDAHLFDCMIRAYRWELWGAAYVIADGCSDDGFSDFRSWLISMGRTVFENALRDPDSLAEAATDPSVEDVFFEEFQYVASRVFEKITGREIPPANKEHPRSPAGEEWGVADLSRLHPKLWATFRATR